jgi:hypothetical protein
VSLGDFQSGYWHKLYDNLLKRPLHWLLGKLIAINEQQQEQNYVLVSPLRVNALLISRK